MVFKRLLSYVSRLAYGGWGGVGDWEGVSDRGGDKKNPKLFN